MKNHEFLVDKNLIQRIKNFLILKKEQEQAKKLLENLNEEYNIQQKQIFDLMFNLDVQSVEVEKYLVYRKISTYPSVEDEETFFNWLRDNGFGDLIKETVNHNTLKGWYKEYIKDNEDADLSNMLKIFEKQELGVRKT